FIPVAEESGLIVPLGEWVLEQACRQLRLWQEQFSTPEPLAVNVNLSPRQLSHPDLVERVQQILQRTGIAPKCLHLEITESALISDSEAAIAMLHQLKALGVQLYLDDFGTGYSSLSRLHELSVDVLKIDRAFIAQQQWSLVCGILYLAAGLGLGVVVEGIETPEELERARNIGCYRCQGYHFARPLGAAGATGLLRRYNGQACQPNRPQGEDWQCKSCC
ncbi:MAG: EAL domain-containing protein, partial [Spirulinaceae cyanobacterium RM2_2_10]|nr:EAL domain-containing protein [Spirulinaceae cyanobacterium RM2_2_10]